MKTYNLSEIAKEYATKNQCGLPLTPEQLLNSVVVYVNGEVTDLESNSFPFTTNEKESVFNVTKLTYSDKTVTLEYTSDVNGKKFTIKQPFGARENGGLTCDANESGTAMEVGIDMTGADENFVLTSVNNTPTWKALGFKKYYAHNVTWSIDDGTGGRMYCTIISDEKYGQSKSYYIEWLHRNLFSEETGNRLQATGFSANRVITGVRAQGTNILSIENFNPATNSIERNEYNVNKLSTNTTVIPIN